MESGSVGSGADDGASPYHALRRALGIAEGAHEVAADQYFPSELGLDYLHGVSFSKGCYVGQELTARTHFQGQVSSCPAISGTQACRSEVWIG